MLHTAWLFRDFRDFCGKLNLSAICAGADIYLILIFHLGKGGEIEVGDLAGDGFLVGGIDEGHATALETGTGETTAIPPAARTGNGSRCRYGW